MATLRRTRIVSTMGPACDSQEKIEALIQAGVNVFRLNFSFGSYEDMARFVNYIKTASAKLNVVTSILGDLQGPKFRTGEQDTEVIELKNGKKLKLAYAPKKSKSGNSEIIYCPHENLMTALKAGDKILIYDGTMELKVVEKPSTTEAVVEVVRGGGLRAHKGLNVPSTLIQFTDLMEKDKQDAEWMLDQQLDYVGMSFVQTAEDIHRLRRYWQERLKPGQKLPLIIAKIEKPQALENLDSIMSATDGVMVARGDLGVELSLEMVPMAQKLIIKKANIAHKPVITATQMLQSMTTESVPTRAEVSDVANSVFDGTDTTMTSQETSMSPHPALVVQTMANILTTTEAHLNTLQHSSAKMWAEIFPQAKGPDTKSKDTIRTATVLAALNSAESARVKAIVVFTATGDFARLVSKGCLTGWRNESDLAFAALGRPNCPIIVVTHSAEVARHINLYYGVYPVVLPLREYTDPTIAHAENAILERGWLKAGDIVVLCSGASTLPGLAYSTRIYSFGTFVGNYAARLFHKTSPHVGHHPEKDES